MKQSPNESDPDNCSDAAELVPALVRRSATRLVAALVDFTDHNNYFHYMMDS